MRNKRPRNITVSLNNWGPSFCIWLRAMSSKAFTVFAMRRSTFRFIVSPCVNHVTPMWPDNMASQTPSTCGTGHICTPCFTDTSSTALIRWPRMSTTNIVRGTCVTWRYQNNISRIRWRRLLIVLHMVTPQLMVRVLRQIVLGRASWYHHAWVVYKARTVERQAKCAWCWASSCIQNIESNGCPSGWRVQMWRANYWENKEWSWKLSLRVKLIPANHPIPREDGKTSPTILANTVCFGTAPQSYKDFWFSTVYIPVLSIMI